MLFAPQVSESVPFVNPPAFYVLHRLRDLVCSLDYCIKSDASFIRVDLLGLVYLPIKNRKAFQVIFFVSS